MDEPFGALDPITKSELHAEFKRLQAALHRAVVLVTHDMAEAFALADRIAVLSDGQIVACDTPAAVRALRRSAGVGAGGNAMSELVAFIAGHRAEFIARLGEHVILVFVSTAIAAAIGIPLGIVAARRPSIAKPIVAIANLAQTIPSLALFGFLIPLPLVGGIGTRTALAALTVYAVLPILRGAITGIQGVAEPVIECAVAMGLTPRQILTAGRVAAGVAVDRLGPARRRRDRRRHGDDRFGDRRGRAWRLHLPRARDGRLDRDPRRRGSGGAARACLRRRARARRPDRRSTPPIDTSGGGPCRDPDRCDRRGGVGVRTRRTGAT